MKKAIKSDDIKPQDFSAGVRGKHSSAYRRGHSTMVLQEDGTTTVQKFVPDKDAVVLDDDVKAYFPDAQAVNAALRGLIKLLPHGRKRAQAN
jgi:hypothetical protein